MHVWGCILVVSSPRDGSENATLSRGTNIGKYPGAWAIPYDQLAHMLLQVDVAWEIDQVVDNVCDKFSKMMPT